METNKTYNVIDNNKDKMQLQEKRIQLQEKRLRLQDKQIQAQSDYINLLQKQLAEQKQKFVNARWIAIYEFLNFFMQTKGEIYDNSYLRSAFDLIDLPLTENNVYWMFEYAAEHLKHDAEYTKQMLGK